MAAAVRQYVVQLNSILSGFSLSHLTLEVGRRRARIRPPHVPLSLDGLFPLATLELLLARRVAFKW